MCSLLQEENIFDELGTTKLHLQATLILKRDFIVRRFYLAEDIDRYYVRWPFRSRPICVLLIC